jgi:hypothetical protein
MRVFPSLLASVSALAIMVAPPVLAQGFPASLSVSSLDGDNGTRLSFSELAATTDWANVVTGLGDINNDGIDDFAVAIETGNDQNDIYVVFGKTGGFGADFDIANRDGSNGFRLRGVMSSVGNAVPVASAGDFNGDGIDDLVMGREFASPGGRSLAGAAYVVFGHSGAFPASLSVATQLDGINGFTLNGEAADESAGRFVRGIGDFNGDGIDDIAIASSTGLGKIQLVFGHTGLFASTFELSSLNGNNGITLQGSATNPIGGVVSGAGNFNGDGFADIVIGASLGDVAKKDGAYVVFGHANTGSADFDVSSVDGTTGVRFKEVDKNSEAGLAVAGIGDVNSDGFDDVLIGAPFYETTGSGGANGNAYVVYGASNFAASVDFPDLDGSNGFSMPGVAANDILGFAVGSAGDVNHDGIADFMVGARLADPARTSNAGSTYVVFGIPDTDTFAPTLDVTSLNGTSGFAFVGSREDEQYGQYIGNAGDVNNDGADDLLIAGRRAALVHGLGTLPSGPTTLFSSVLPSARSGVRAGDPITVFASVINAGANRDDNCRITIPPSSVTLSYQATNSLNVPTGLPDQVFAINAGETKSFLLAFDPQVTTFGSEVFPNFVCEHSDVDQISGVNTVFFHITNSPQADILSISATPTNDGIIVVPRDGINFMSVSAINIGSGTIGSEVIVRPDNGFVNGSFVNLPLLLQICETDAVGTCMAPPAPQVTSTLAAGGAPHFYGVFVSDQNSGGLALDPAINRVFLRFTDAAGAWWSVTSAAVTVP